MENNSQSKIDFKQSRSIGRMFGIIISWLKVNYISLIKATFISAIVATIIVIAITKWNINIFQNITTIASLSTADVKIPKGVITKHILWLAFSLITFAILLLVNSCIVGTTYKMLNVYSQQDSTTVFFKIKNYYKSSFRRALRIFAMSLFSILLFLIFVIICSPLNTILIKSIPIPFIVALCVGSIFLAIPFSFIITAYGSTDLKFFAAFKQGFVLGSRYWGRCFVFFFVLIILLGLTVALFSLPYYVMGYMFMDYHYSLADGNLSSLPFYVYILYTIAIIITAAVYYFAFLVFSISTYVIYNNCAKHREDKIAFKKNNEKTIEKDTDYGTFNSTSPRFD